MIHIATIPAEGLDFETFLEVPRTIHDQGSRWREHSSARTRRMLARGLNPFWRQAESALFLAWAGARPVGRIGATRRSLAGQEAAGARDGFFGFFESIADPEVARALLTAAADWLRERGCTRLLGPCQPTPDFDGFGLLVEGFDARRLSGESFNPDYYPALFAACGLHPEKDYFSFQNNMLDNPVFEREMARLGRYRARHASARVRSFDVARFDRDTAIVRDILACAYADQPLYAPLDFDTYAFHLHTLARREDMHWFLIVEIDGQPVGVNLLAPNENERLHGAAPRGIGTSEFSILPEYHHTQAAAALFHDSWARARRQGFAWASMAYQDEHHVSMHRMLEKVGSFRAKRFRLYQMPLNAATDPASTGPASALALTTRHPGTV